GMDETLKPPPADDSATGPDWAYIAVQRSAEFFEHAPLGICISRPSSGIVACNAAFARILGFASVEEAIGVDMATLYAREGGRAQFLAQLRRDRRLDHYRTTLRSRDGRLLHVIVNVVGTFDADGTLTEICGYLTDDTASVEADRALHEREQLFRAIFF